jgi:hypothetical protein
VKFMLPIQPRGCRRRSSERSRWLWAAARTHQGLSWCQYAISYVSKLKLEIAVQDERVEDVVEAIQNAARSCKIGEGKISSWTWKRHGAFATGETARKRHRCRVPCTFQLRKG